MINRFRASSVDKKPDCFSVVVICTRYKYIVDVIGRYPAPLAINLRFLPASDEP